MMAPPDPHLSIVVPAYNESARIGSSLASIVAWAEAQSFPVEIIVVDDGSLDETVLVARAGLDGAARPKGIRAAVLMGEPNRGKGYAIRRGVLAATGALVLVTDADLSTPIEEASRLLDLMGRLGEPGLVIGSRDVGDSRVEVHQNAVREMMGKVFNRVVRTITGLPFHDTQCGFKLMSREAVTPLFARARIDGFSYDVELLFLARRQGLPIREVGVTWRNAPGSKVGMLADPLRMLRDVFRVRIWEKQGAYDG